MFYVTVYTNNDKFFPTIYIFSYNRQFWLVLVARWKNVVTNKCQWIKFFCSQWNTNTSFSRCFFPWNYIPTPEQSPEWSKESDSMCKGILCSLQFGWNYSLETKNNIICFLHAIGMKPIQKPFTCGHGTASSWNRWKHGSTITVHGL